VSSTVSELAIDLGTASTLIHADGRLVAEAPSVVAIAAGRVVAVGHAAKGMLGRVPSGVRVVRPLAGGVIGDLEACTLMLGAMLDPIRRGRRTRVVVSVPLDTTEVERHAVAAVCERLGAAPRTLIDEPLAAAIGSGLPVAEAQASMVVDAGEGITEAAVLSCGGVVASCSVRVGGGDLDRALAGALRSDHGLAVGEVTAERLKLSLGCDDGSDLAVGGMDLASGRPRRLTVARSEILAAVKEPLDRVVDAVRTGLERTPAELSSDLVEQGMTLTGGTALLPGLADRLHRETGLRVQLAPDPLRSVLLGNAALL
jgi:rod shape-determining protein MreB and related proteins